MKVILLCAGYATRLYPLTENTPKPLLSVGSRPILEWILDRVQEVQGVDAAYIITNHKFAGHFADWVKKTRYPWPVEVIDDQTSSDETRLGALGDLAYALKQKNVGREDVLVIAGDNLFTFDLAEFVNRARATTHAAIAVYDVQDRELAKQYGLVLTAADGKVIEFLEKPQNPPTTLASCGLYWLPAKTRLLLDRYISDGHNSDQPGHYMRWLAETAGLYAVPLKGEWLDIGDRASYDKANTQYTSRKGNQKK